MPEQNDILEMPDILDDLQDDIINDPIQDPDDASDQNEADYAAAAAAIEDDLSASADKEAEMVQEDLDEDPITEIPETAVIQDPAIEPDSQDQMDELIMQPEMPEMDADVMEALQAEQIPELPNADEGQMESSGGVSGEQEGSQQDLDAGNTEPQISAEPDRVTDRDGTETPDMQKTDMDASSLPDADQPDPLTIQVVDANVFAAMESMEPGTAYVVTGDNLESPVLVYPDENGNMHAVDTFYAVDGGFLISGSEAEPFMIDPVTGNPVPPMESVADYIDSRVMDMSGDIFETVQQDMEMTDFETTVQDMEAGNFEASMDTGMDAGSFLSDSVDADPRSDAPEYDPADTGSLDIPETDRHQDFLPDNDLMSSEQELMGQDTVTAENIQQDTAEDVKMDMISYDYSDDLGNDMDLPEDDYTDRSGYDEPDYDWSSDSEDDDWEQREDDK